MKRLVVLAVAVIAAVGAKLLLGKIQHERGERDQRDLETLVFRGQTNYATLTNATRVTAQRLHFKEGNEFRLDSYTQDEPVVVAPEIARKLKTLLQQRSSYSGLKEESFKSCVLDYGVLLSFQTPQQTLRVALCLNCDDLGIFTEGDGVQNGEKVVDFHQIERQLRLAAKAIFPNDPEIQELRVREK